MIIILSLSAIVAITLFFSIQHQRRYCKFAVFLNRCRNLYKKFRAVANKQYYRQNRLKIRIHFYVNIFQSTLKESTEFVKSFIKPRGPGLQQV